jgi:bacterioferritin-associated ferredoxin
MIVCICHRVSEAQIARHVAAGCRDFADLQDELRVATGCGACHDCARSTFDAACIGADAIDGARRRVAERCETA